jgi:hypothetical protein
MTFDEAERSDSPQPSWTSKDGGDELASEIQTVTTDNVLQRTRSIYDSVTENITNEVARGLCSICGRPLAENNVVLCHYGDLVCNACMIFYNGRSICRKHTEFYLGSKPEAIVLISIAFGLNKNDIKQISKLSENSIVIAKNMLANRGYVKIKSLGLIGNSTKITESGVEIAETLVAAYRSDFDFRIFLENIGWSKNVETRPEQK